MPAPAIFAKVGAVIGKAVAGTAKGISAAAKGTAKMTAKGTKSGAKSGGKLTKSSTKVRNNITKSNKRISKIKKNRQRIKKSIKNEQQRLQKERNLERKRTSNKIPGSGILNNPVISGLKKFIYTLLFGLAITNIEKIMKGIKKVKDMIVGFIKFIVDIKNGVDNIISSFKGDDERLEKERDNVDSALGQVNSALDNIGDIEGLEKQAKNANQKQLKFMNGSSDIASKAQQEGSIPWQQMDLLQLNDEIKRIEEWGGKGSKKLIIEMQKRVVFLKWAEANDIDLTKPLDMNKIKTKFNMKDIELSKNNNLNGLNSSTDQNMVVVNKTIIKKEFVPVPYSA